MSSGRYNDFNLFCRLLKQARSYRLHLAMIVLRSFLSIPLTLLTPVPLKLAVDHVIGTQPLPQYLAPLLPGTLSGSPIAIMFLAVVLLLSVVLLQNLEGFGSWLLQLYTGEKLALDFRGRLLGHLQRLSILYHDRQGLADSLYRIQVDATAIQYLLIQGVIPML